jgi:hypothetical protein
MSVLVLLRQDDRGMSVLTRTSLALGGAALQTAALPRAACEELHGMLPLQ